jgi:hypothetical protein
MNNFDEKQKLKILGIIKEHLGKDNPIQVDDLMDKVLIPDREIRRIVQYLINEEKYPIGSTTKGPYGFFMIVSFEDYLEAVKNLTNRKEKLKERVSALREACIREGIQVPKIDFYDSKSKTIFKISNSVVIYFK